MNLFITLGGLLILTLMLASLLRRYQERMAEKRLRIQRIIRGVDEIEDLLRQSTGCSLPAEIERVLREDVLARFHLVRKISRRFKGIAALIEGAEQALAQPPGGPRQRVQDKYQLQQVIKDLGELMDFLRAGRLLQPLPVEQLRRYVEQVGTRRAECVYRFHMEQAVRLRQAGRLHDALTHCNRVRTFVHEYGPANEQVKAWYAEAEVMRKELREAEVAADE